MELASVHSAEENSFMWDLINGRNEGRESAFAWIGFTDKDIETIFVWSDGTPVDYTKWISDRPSSGDTLDCTLMSWGDGTWFDYHCSHDFGVLCRRPGSP